MLILSRRIGESIKIGDEVTVTVLGATGTQIRLGIEAPKEVSVHREEIYHRIAEQEEQKLQKQQAAAAPVVTVRPKIVAASS